MVRTLDGKQQRIVVAGADSLARAQRVSVRIGRIERRKVCLRLDRRGKNTAGGFRDAYFFCRCRTAMGIDPGGGRLDRSAIGKTALSNFTVSPSAIRFAVV